MNSFQKEFNFQDELTQRMLERLHFLNLNPNSILRLGSGRCSVSNRVFKDRFPNAHIFEMDKCESSSVKLVRKSWWRRYFPFFNNSSHLVGLSEDVPFRDNSLDLLWCYSLGSSINSLEKIFSEANRVLRTGGFFTFVAFGPDTLWEIKKVLGEVQSKSVKTYAKFEDMHDIGDRLMSDSMIDPVIDMEKIVLKYSFLPRIFEDLSKIGGVFALDIEIYKEAMKIQGGLTEAEASYKKLLTADEYFPVTLEVIYGHAWKNSEENSVNHSKVIDIKPI